MSFLRTVQTIKLVDDTLIVAASSIDLLCIGALKGSFTGNDFLGTNSVAVDIPTGYAYSFEYNERGYNNILVDASGTEIHIVLKF